MLSNCQTATVLSNSSCLDNNRELIRLGDSNDFVSNVTNTNLAEADSMDLTNIKNRNIRDENFKLINEQKEKILFNSKQLMTIRSLKKDWDHKGTLPFDKKMIKKVSLMLEKIEYQPYLFPTFENSIQIEYELSDEYYLEFEIFPKSIKVYYEMPNNDDEYTIPYKGKIPTDRINKIVRKFYYEFEK